MCNIQVPASKSIAQRAVAAALLADGTSVVENFPCCNDATVALDIAQALGAKVNQENGILHIEGGFSGLLHCVRNDVTADISHKYISAGESALSLRMFAPIAALSGKKITFSGKGSLLSRPVEMIVNALRQGGVECTTNNGVLPLTLSGRLQSGHFHIDGAVTSQVLTGLLMALPVVTGDSVVVVENLKSKPYIDITLEVLQSFGIVIENIDYKTFIIHGNQQYKPCRYAVEGDWSSAAVWMVAGAIHGDISISGLNPNSKQADRAILDVLKTANCTVEYREGVFISKKSEIKPFTFDASDCPDLIPVLTLLAVYATGVSKIYGAQRLKHKESDRTSVLIREFEKTGISITQHNDVLEITGGVIHSAEIDPHNDHRIAMTFAIASLGATSAISVKNPECVDKSYPDFWRDLERVNGAVNN
jgi:3-phosphoshikimate 1-carboxyvinyltransferase